MDQSCQKGYFQPKMKKDDYHSWVLYNQICLSFKLHLKLTILIFLEQIWPRRVFPVKNKKSKQHHWIMHIRFMVATKFQFKLIVMICISCRKWKIEQHHWALHIWLSLRTKVHLKLITLIFRTKYAPKGSKTTMMNSITEFCIFE